MYKRIEELKQTASKVVQITLDSYPQLKEWAKVHDLKSIQAWIETNFSKQAKLDWVIRKKLENTEIGKAINVVCESESLETKLVYKCLGELILHRRTSIDVMCNIMKHHFEVPSEMFSFIDKLKELKLVKYIDNVLITREELALTKNEELELDLFQSNPAMVCKPKKLWVTKDEKIKGGYLHLNRSIFTKKADPHCEVPLDFLNKQNYLKYKINYKFWFEYGIDHPYIPEQEDGEDDDTYKKKVDDALRCHFKKMYIIGLYYMLGIDFIYILNQFDYRGRNYPVAYLFNPQGTDIDKALLCFEPETITTEGIKWLKISIANNFNCEYLGKDLDKNKFDNRIQWFEDNMKPLTQLDKDEYFKHLNVLAKDADSPWSFWSQMHNYWYIVKAIEQGKTPKVWVICHFDATASGYQFQSIFARDWNMAQLVNVIPNKNGERIDLYTVLYERLIANGLPSIFKRNQIKKKCFIPAVYNSKRSIEELLVKPEYIKKFNEVMGEYRMWKLNRTFPSLWDSMADEYSFYTPDGFKVYKKIVQNVSVDVPYGNTTVTLHFKKQAPQEYSLELGPNLTHACDGFAAREISRGFGITQKQYNYIVYLSNHPSLWKYDDIEAIEEMEKLIQLGKNFNYYSWVILNKINKNNIAAVPKEILDQLLKEVDGLSTTKVSEIHDSFGVCPNYAADLMKVYKIILVKLAKSRYLPAVIDYLKGNPEGDTTQAEVAEEFLKAIEQSEYALC